MIPDLSDMDVQTLAEKYDFSGGQIENIARHYNIDCILHDTSTDALAMLIGHCDNGAWKAWSRRESDSDAGTPPTIASDSSPFVTTAPANTSMWLQAAEKNGLFNQGKQLSAWFHGLSNIFYYICK